MAQDVNAIGGPSLADQITVYLANRLSSRKTFLQYGSTLMGPILDKAGAEQGGVLSSDQFQLVENNELNITNETGFGLPFGICTLSSIGVADDVVLLSPTPYGLQSLMNLSMEFCNDVCWTPVPSKTKLLIFIPKKSPYAGLCESSTLITVNGDKIEPSEEAEHVGLLRSASGSSLPAVHLQLSKLRKALHSTLSFGSSRSYFGNPAASLQVENIYAHPVLLFGLCCLLLNKTKLKLISFYLKTTLQQLQKLFSKTPSPAVHFLAGSLPFTAAYHLGCLQLFGRVTLLASNNPPQVYKKQILEFHFPARATNFNFISPKIGTFL